MNNINVFCHSSIKFNMSKVIYVDPFKIKEEYNDADLVLITHSHYDHFSKEDILKIKNNNTVIVITEDLYEEVQKLGFDIDNIFVVKPNDIYDVLNLKIETIPAYNINKKFHPKENNWVGYIITIDEIIYYIAGDTDITDENLKVKCDIALIPIGGTYTINYEEAAKLTNIIKPKEVIPIHYGDIVGTKEDAQEFQKLIDKDIKCSILIN